MTGSASAVRTGRPQIRKRGRRFREEGVETTIDGWQVEQKRGSWTEKGMSRLRAELFAIAMEEGG